MLMQRLKNFRPPPARSWWWMGCFYLGGLLCVVAQKAEAHHVPTWVQVLAALAAGWLMTFVDGVHEKAVRRAIRNRQRSVFYRLHRSCADGLSPQESMDMDERAMDLAGAKGVDA